MEYALDHLLLFSPHVYWRMLQHYVAQHWWLAVGLNLLLLALFTLVERRWRLPVLFIVLVFCWIWLGWRFYIIEYASINWFALYMGVACLMVLPILLAPCLRGGTENMPTDWALLYLSAGYVVLIRPLIIGMFNGQLTVSAIGLLPVPTLLLTMGIIFSVRFSWRWLMLLACCLLLLIETVTLYLLDSPLWQEVPTILMLWFMMSVSGRYSSAKKCLLGSSAR